MKKRGEKNIFIGGSLYSLLLYLLVAKSDDIEQTFFFFSNSKFPIVFKSPFYFFCI